MSTLETEMSVVVTGTKHEKSSAKTNSDTSDVSLLDVLILT